MTVEPTRAPHPAPRVYLYCPECGEPTTIRSLMPLMFTPSVEQITHSCESCGADTRVELAARLPRRRSRRETDIPT